MSETNTTTTNTLKKPIINHLVLSGGGPSLIQTLGVLQELETQHFIQRENIQTIYGTSAGSIAAVIYALNFDWNTVNDYILKRPWKDVFYINFQNLLDAYTKKGIFDLSTIEKCFKPLLSAKDLDLTIHLKDFYAFSKIELHFFTFELNQFQMDDVSYLTHPDVSLLAAIQMSCALPVLLSPVCLGDKCYIDGGVGCNYPLRYCLEKYPHEIESILGVKNEYGPRKQDLVKSESTLLDFIMNFLFKLLYLNIESYEQPCKIPYEVICNTEYMSIEYLKSVFSNEQIRVELLQNGVKSANQFLDFFSIPLSAHPY